MSCFLLEFCWLLERSSSSLNWLTGCYFLLLLLMFKRNFFIFWVLLVLFWEEFGSWGVRILCFWGFDFKIIIMLIIFGIILGFGVRRFRVGVGCILVVCFLWSFLFGCVLFVECCRCGSSLGLWFDCGFHGLDLSGEVFFYDSFACEIVVF